MAINTTYDALNPKVADANAPDYTRGSFAVKDFDLKSATGLALKGAGEMIEGAIKGADEVVKAYSREDIRNEIEPMKYAYEEALGGGLKYAKNAAAPAGNVVTDAGGNTQAYVDNQTPPLNLLPALDEKSLPNDIKQLPGRLGDLSGARASGKLSETDYYARLSSTAKDIRSRYPVAYRDYIDKQISEVTGVDPANAFIKSVIGDINSILGEKAKDKEHALSFLRQHLGALPPQTAAALHAGVLSGVYDSNAVVQALAEPLRIQFERTERQANRDDRKNQRTEDTDLDKQDFQKDAAGMVQKGLSSVNTQPGQTSFQTTTKMIQDAYAGKIALDSTQYKQAAQGMRSLRAQIEQEILAHGQTFSRTIGPGGIRDTTKDSLYVVDQVIDALDKENVGLAYEAMQMNKLKKDSVEHQLLNMGGINAYLLTMNAVRASGGDHAAQLLTERAFATGLVPQLQGVVKHISASMAVPSDPRRADNITSLSQAFTKTTAALKQAGTGETQTAMTLDSLTKIIDGDKFSLMDPQTSDAQKIEIVKKVFGPENWGLLRKIHPDTVDEKGNTIPGYHSLYYRYTRPEVIEQIKKLDAKEPGLLKMHEDWMKTSFEKDIAREELSKLKSTNFQSPGWKIGWDSDHQELMILNKNNRPWTATDQRQSIKNPVLGPGGDVVLSINGLNKGLDGLVQFAKSTGKDPNSVIQYLVSELGLTSETTAAGMQGIPADIARALLVQANIKETDRAIESGKAEAIKNKYKKPTK